MVIVRPSGHPLIQDSLRPVLGNKDLAFGSEVEGIPNGFLRVSYVDAFFRLGFELSG